VDLTLLAALRSPVGAEALAAAASADPDPIRAAASLRQHGFPSDLAAAALTQVELRRQAVAKFGPDAARMFFTRAGLEQATRAIVAALRAGRLHAAGVATMVDLGCGLGSDAIAFARAGIDVTAVEADPLTAAMAEANARAAGVCLGVRVERAEAVDLSAVDAVFCDPARRSAAKRVFDPDTYSPPWSFVAALPDRVPIAVLKLAPGFPHDRIPAGAEAQWVSVDGELVELALWSGRVAQLGRRASVIRGATVSELTATHAKDAAVGAVGTVLYDPDPAVVRSHLVAEFAASVDGRLADATIAYVYADSLTPTPLARAYTIHDVMPFSLKRLRSLVRDRQIGRLTIKKRGSALLPEALRRQLKPRGPGEATIVLTRVAGAPTVLWCQPALG
jgi:SAM-dependent methyltransferase